VVPAAMVVSRRRVMLIQMLLTDIHVRAWWGMFGHAELKLGTTRVDP
jgi:hypothetical protein